jgi:glutamyl-tRNA reductase
MGQPQWAVGVKHFLNQQDATMSLMVLGVDHRSAPTSVRESLAFPGECHGRGLGALKASFPDTEFVLLSTCNRVEVYAAAESAPPQVDELSSFLARFHGMPAESVAGHAVLHREEAAIGHLFRVAAGLESLVPGEDQILGQVRDAYKAATGRGVIGPILHTVFQRALRAAKRARDETGLGRGKLSVASIAVAVARDVFDHFDDKTILVIGAGKMGELALQHLRALRPGAILVANRDLARARTAVDGGDCRVIAFDALDGALTEADIVISTTAAAEPIMTLDRFTGIQRARRNRPLLIVDIAVPRDFDPRIGELEQVMLYDVDDLRAQVERNLSDRRERLEKARALVERDAAACFAALRYRRDAGTLLRQLADRTEAAVRRELDRLFLARPDLTDTQRAAIAQAMSRSLNQLLHHPRSALRAAADAGDPADPHPLLDAARRVFGLADAPPANQVDPRRPGDRRLAESLV